MQKLHASEPVFPARLLLRGLLAPRQVPPSMQKLHASEPVFPARLLLRGLLAPRQVPPSMQKLHASEPVFPARLLLRGLLAPRQVLPSERKQIPYVPAPQHQFCCLVQIRTYRFYRLIPYQNKTLRELCSSRILNVHHVLHEALLITLHLLLFCFEFLLKVNLLTPLHLKLFPLFQHLFYCLMN